ncbi:MAG: hypothetical protein GF400_00720 [Candidatus Eisenbacteria bacterium]|nr:hypothetical protein [Candidatus Eisenbacteria bacterium]
MKMAPRNMLNLIENLLGEEAVELLRRLGEIGVGCGAPPCVVGGVVRDALIGIANQDLDIVVEGDGETFAARAADELGGSVKAHTRFGTAIVVLPDGRKIDVASARSESYERPGALPRVEPGSVEQDLLRRDFTINSMAVRVDPQRFGQLLDLYGGRKDLEDGVLRVLTDRSFVDDPTRILRGVRFSARFGFRFEKRTERLLREAVRNDTLATVSGERIMNEIVLILQEREPWPPVARMIDWEILTSIERSWRGGPELEATFTGLATLLREEPLADAVPEEERWSVFLLAMIEPLSPDERQAVLQRLRAGRTLRRLASGLARAESPATREVLSAGSSSPSEVYGTLEGVPPEALALRLALSGETREATRIRLYLSELRHVRPALDGTDLAELGVGEGREVGLLLRKLLEARLDGTVTNDEEERALAERLSNNLDAGNKI